jgi:Transposase domain (DUF772)
MRGIDHQQGHMFSYLSPEKRVRQDHPLRAVRAVTDEILGKMSRLFGAMYARRGRPSIPPEKLLRAQLLQMLYSVRSERLLTCRRKQTCYLWPDCLCVPSVSPVSDKCPKIHWPAAFRITATRRFLEAEPK